MFEQECVPFAPALIESMRSLGYSFPAAIADLIDNSVSAKAKNIEILSQPSDDPYLLIIDDGEGMSEKELYEAMRYGSTNPLEERAVDDLGRFGLGLKSASLSQCRKLVVASKKDGKIHAYSWNLDHVIESQSWMLEGFSDTEIAQFPQINLLEELDNGTYVYLSDFDRIKESTSNISATFSKCLDDMINHLSLVFHRFIDGGLSISVNGMEIEAKDPFLTYHKATQCKRDTSFYINGQKITMKPYILPHLSKLSQEDLDKVGGKERLRNDQGFYVYRNKRLIVWGTWFRLERKDELNKLARVRVDIPNSLDFMWSIDVKKSTATLPDMIKKNMYSAVRESVLKSEAVHTYRGRKENKDKDIDFVWERIKVRDGYEYLINRGIPQLDLLSSTLDEDQLKLLNSALDAIEDAFPVSALYVDAAKGKVEDKRIEPGDEFEKVWDDLQVQMDYVRQHGLSEKLYYEAFLRVEPYCNNEELKSRIQKEIEKL